MVLYVLIGILLNLMYDLLITTLGEESEKLRFSFRERLVAIVLWTLALYQFIKGANK